MDSICVFCGAQDAAPEVHQKVAAEMGKAIAKAGKTLVYGGGDCGLMGACANASLAAGGDVIGVFPRSLRDIEKEHQSLTEIHVVDSMHERKHLMYEKSDGFAIFPGGFGTMDEFFEVLTWRQLKLHDKPIIIFNHEGYWDHLVALMERVITTKFAREETWRLFEVVDTFEEVKERFGL